MAEKKITADKKAEEAVKDGRKGSKDRSKGNKGKEGNCKESS